MILLSFTSATKYILGLLFVMLGFIPYEALEKSKSESKPKIVEVQELAENEVSTFGSFNAVEYIYEVENSDPQSLACAATITSSDSVCVLIVKMESDSTVFFISN